MRNNRCDIDRVLQAWMAEGPTAIPDRVVDVVASRITLNRQRRRAWPFPGRTNVTTQIKLIAGLAAALVVAVAGYSLLPGTTGPGSPSSVPTPSAQPTPAATAAPTAAPSTTATWPTWFTPEAIRDANGAGILAAGNHATRVFDPGFTYDAPEGWVNGYDEPNYFNLFPDTPANAAQSERSNGELAHVIFGGLHPSPYFTCQSAENNLGATAADKVAAMTSTEALAVSGLVDVAMGSLTGKQMDVRRNPDWTGTCTGDAGLPEGVDPEDERTRAFLLDVPGRGVLVIFMYSISSAEHDVFLAEAMPILESFEFGPVQ